MEQKLSNLRIKKATLFSHIEMMSTVSDTLFRDFGKVCAEIMQLEKKIVRETKNHFNED
ncbi:hypothetical protein LXD69_07320 [Flavobacterium sediminilitoris]|uniref:Uncharacterized protein n=1 Tax=Flavobacterium sediminilitoris TaxID=2024526 RepID=A0ABY4HQZ5_9FLAO|nr:MULTISPECIES: hypothetical protein [Flavobacterium]UOX35321.1 hypothetical protein LXD69_07320 [Flavobacterium sediminilitoris]